MKGKETAADLALSLELPLSAGSGMEIRVYERRRLVAEHHRGLLNYSPEQVEISGGALRLRVLGSGLEVRAMDRETLILTGFIAALEYD